MKKNEVEVITPEVIEDDDKSVPESAPVGDALKSSLETELKRFDKFEARLSELKKYSELTIKDENDREGYMAVKAAIADLRRTRTGTTKDKKVAKEFFQSALDSIEKKSKWIIAEVSAIEDPLQQRKDEIDAIKEKIREDKKAAQLKQYKDRLSELLSMGAVIVGDNFELNGLRVEVAIVESADEDVYREKIFPIFKSEWQKIEDAKEAQRKRDLEAAAEVERQKQELAEQQKKLEEQQKQLQEALNKQRKEKEDARCRQLGSLGMTYNLPHSSFLFMDVNVGMVEIKTLNDDEWTALVSRITPVIEDRKKQQEQARIDEEKKKVRKDLIEQRVKMLSYFEYKHPNPDELGDMSEEKWQLLHSDCRAEYNKREHNKWLEKQAQENQEKLDKASDKNKWEAILAHLQATPIVEMKSKPYQAKMLKLQAFLSDIHAI